MKLRPSFVLLGSLLVAISPAACGKGDDGAPGTDGPPGAPGANAPAASDPTVNQINPRVGLVDRTVEVLVAFDGKFDPANATLDFGDGIKVAKVAAQGNALVAEVTIEATAKLGKHDVVVKAGSKTITAKGGFTVAVPLDAKIGAGKAEQGGLVRLDVANRDRVQLDPDNFYLLPIAGAKDPTLISMAYQGFTATNGSVVLLGDPLAKAGALGFLGVNDPQNPDSASFLTAPDAVTVAARTPTNLAAGTPADKTFANDLETGFYTANLAPTGSEGFIVDTWAKLPEGSTAKPMILAYPASGSIADLLDQQVEEEASFFGPATQARVAYPITAATKAFFVVLDVNLAHGPTTKVSVDLVTTRAQILSEKSDPHGTAATAQNLGSLPGTTTTVPGRIVKGELKEATEVDYYTLTSLSTTRATDLQLSVASEADVVVRIDTVPTFDSENVLTLTRGGTAGRIETEGFVGATRYIEVKPAADSGKPTGKYTLGFKRLEAPLD